MLFSFQKPKLEELSPKALKTPPERPFFGGWS